LNKNIANLLNVPIKITRNLSIGFIFVGILAIFLPFIGVLFSGVMIIILGFGILLLLSALKKLGTITGIVEINYGLRILGILILIAFFVLPALVSLMLPYEWYIVGGLSISFAVLGLASNFFLMYGLMKYGELEGSRVLKLASLIIIISTMIITVNPISYQLFNPYILSLANGYLPLVLIFLDLFAGAIVLIASILIAFEFSKISERIKQSISRDDINEIQEQLKNATLKEALEISRKKGIPFLLAAYLI